jgi:hypothetical protein
MRKLKNLKFNALECTLTKNSTNCRERYVGQNTVNPKEVLNMKSTERGRPRFKCKMEGQKNWGGD